MIHFYDPGRQRKWAISILHQDEALIGIDKPSGVPVIPERWRPEWPCLQSILHERRGEKPFVVHRIDAATSGVVVMARTAEAHKMLSEQFAKHEVEKVYVAIVRGEIAADEQAIELPVAPHASRAGEMMIAKNGKPAMTRLRVVERFCGYTLIEARPSTGRQHQIRVHLQAISHPLIVDPIYGRQEAFYLSSLKPHLRVAKDEEQRALISRLTLHAASVRFRHPNSGAALLISAALPKDFLAALKSLRKYAPIR